MHQSLIRLHHIVDKAAEILAHIRKDHHAQPLKNVLLHLAHIENALARLEEPIFATAVHLILCVEARVLITLPINRNTPAIPTVLIPAAEV